MQHIEFFHKEHFEKFYHRVKPVAALAHFIDYFWETDFDTLWKDHPKGFSDVLFPNIGYTYLINLGTPFIMQLENRSYRMKGDGFLPRHTCLECYHQPGNKLFGIKFKISPVLFEKRINFAEYKAYIFPLSYLLDPSVPDQVKQAAGFRERVGIVSDYYARLVKNYSGTLQPIQIVSEIIEESVSKNRFDLSVSGLAAQYRVSPRTLQRYFETTLGISSKKALQVLRIRKAVGELSGSPETFQSSAYGYHDHSHFVKHLKSFLQKETLKKRKLHLELLQELHQ